MGTGMWMKCYLHLGARFDKYCEYRTNESVLFQNSVLGLVLANQHFGNPLTAVPCAVSSVCHSIIGSALAGFWRWTTPSPKENQE